MFLWDDGLLGIDSVKTNSFAKTSSSDARTMLVYAYWKKPCATAVVVIRIREIFTVFKNNFCSSVFGNFFLIKSSVQKTIASMSRSNVMRLAKGKRKHPPPNQKR